MSEPVIIEYQSGPLAGAQYQIESAERAAEVHPDATIISLYDGRPYEASGTPEPSPVASPVVPVAAQPAAAVAQPTGAGPEGAG